MHPSSQRRSKLHKLKSSWPLSVRISIYAFSQSHSTLISILVCNNIAFGHWSRDSLQNRTTQNDAALACSTQQVLDRTNNKKVDSRLLLAFPTLERHSSLLSELVTSDVTTFANYYGIPSGGASDQLANTLTLSSGNIASAARAAFVFVSTMTAS